MSGHRNYLFIFLIILTLVVGGCGGMGRGRGGAANLSGLVVDSNFAPLSGVTAFTGRETATSNSDGSYRISAISNGTYVVTLSKAGYTTSYRKIKVSGGTAQVPLAILTPLDGKTTLIDAAGGIASNTDGSTKINIPPGAVTGGIRVSLTRVEVIAAPYPPPTGSMFVAVIVYVTPSDAVMTGTSAEVSIPNVTGIADGTTVQFYHFDITSANWIFVINGSASASTDTITAEVSQFGWIAAILPYSPNAGNITGTVTESIHGNPIPFASVWSSSFSTVCNSLGSFQLSNVPTGETTVEAIAIGYGRGSSTVNVPKGPAKPPPVNIILNPISAGTIMGHVYIKSLGPKTAIPGARVVAQPTGQPLRQTLTDSNGSYTFANLPAFGSVSVSVFADSYLSSSESISPFNSGDNVTRDFYLVHTATATEFAENFESAGSWNNWTKTQKDSSCTWQRVQNPETITDNLYPAYVSLEGSANLPSAEGDSYAAWFGDTIGYGSAEGNYVGVQKSDDSPESGGTTSVVTPHVDIGGALVSPSIDMTAWAFAKLSFWTWWETECINIASGFDKMIVEVSGDGGSTWSTIGILNPSRDPDQSQREPWLPYSSGGFDQPGVWVKHVFDLSQYVGKAVKIRFTFNAVDEKYNGFRGWLLDDVILSPEQVGASSVSSASVGKRPDRGIIRAVPR